MIRQATPEDAQRLVEIYGYYVANTAISFEYEVPSVEEFRSRIENTIKDFPYLVIEEEGKILGYAYASKFAERAAYAHSAELSIYLDREAKGRGYGRALYEALEQSLQEQGILNLYAHVADPIQEDEYLTRNSEHFHQHMGFTTVGTFHQCGQKFGRWYNILCMEKIIGEHVEAEKAMNVN